MEGFILTAISACNILIFNCEDDDQFSSFHAWEMYKQSSRSSPRQPTRPRRCGHWRRSPCLVTSEDRLDSILHLSSDAALDIFFNQADTDLDVSLIKRTIAQDLFAGKSYQSIGLGRCGAPNMF